MQDCKPYDTPISKGEKFSLDQCPKTDLDRKFMEGVPYASAVGSIMYAQVCTRPDLAFIVGMLGGYQSNPGRDHWVAAKRVFRYLQKTKDYMLTYRKSDQLEIIGYSVSDVGCGFGGLLISLAMIFPETLMIGMELRDKVTKHAKERILALRLANGDKYQNVSVVRTNSMKYISNYFEKGQLSKMFFLFPDPHFKEKNHGRRVISPHLLDEYACVLRIGGIIYTITEVEELGDWMKACLRTRKLRQILL